MSLETSGTNPESCSASLAHSDELTQQYVRFLERGSQQGMCEIGYHPYTHTGGGSVGMAVSEMRLVLFPVTSAFALVSVGVDNIWGAQVKQG